MQTWARSLDFLPHSQPLLVAHTNLSQVLFLQPPLTGLCSLDTLFRIRVHYFLIFLFPMLSPPPKLLSLRDQLINRNSLPSGFSRVTDVQSWLWKGIWCSS